MPSLLVTGGGGFVGSHVAERFAKEGWEVTVFDNLSRGQLLAKDEINVEYNWNYLAKYDNVRPVRGDVRDIEGIEKACEDVDVVVHAAAQTAVTTSTVNPRTDFEVNALGTFNVLEAARKARSSPAVVHCSTNKVFGSNVEKATITEKAKRYSFSSSFEHGIPLNFPIDHCEHTPYGCSKLAADLYVQDYGRLYGLKTGVFRMSCVYGERQFGVEYQGWLAWFAIATLTGKTITIYGDGKQVRDVLYVSDLVDAFSMFLTKEVQGGSVFNIGGGPGNTISLLELLDLLEEYTGKRSRVSYSDWRPSDQKVYISDISQAEKILGWRPKTTAKDGVKRLLEWVGSNIDLFH